MASNVIIPVKHYVGLIKRENSKLPLAFITPWGEDSAAKKRIDTVNTWAGNTRNWRGHTQLESQIIENVPLIGLKISIYLFVPLRIMIYCMLMLVLCQKK